jgi:hypothetical protein
MNDKQFKIFVDAIRDVSSQLKYIGDAISADEPLNYSVGRSLDKIAHQIEFSRMYST